MMTTADIHRTISDARAFRKALRAFAATPHSRRELDLGEVIRRLAVGLQALEGIVPGVRDLRSVVEELIGRWGWERVVGSDGESFLAERRATWEAKQREYLAAVLSHVNSYEAGKITTRPPGDYRHIAGGAKREGIAPREPAVESTDEVERIHREWIFSPYLGPGIPTWTADDLAELEAALTDVEDGTPEEMMATLAPVQYGHLLPGGHKATRSERAKSSEDSPSVQPESAPGPAKVKENDTARVMELKDLRYLCMSQDKANQRFGVSTGGSNKDFATRAKRYDQIKDIQILDGKLWILPFEKKTLGP
jgi:hypothetical protein